MKTDFFFPLSLSSKFIISYFFSTCQAFFKKVFIFLKVACRLTFQAFQESLSQAFMYIISYLLALVKGFFEKSFYFFILSFQKPIASSFSMDKSIVKVFSFFIYMTLPLKKVRQVYLSSVDKAL